jgi:hypothetical protein
MDVGGQKGLNRQNLSDRQTLDRTTMDVAQNGDEHRTEWKNGTKRNEMDYDCDGL